MSKKNRVKKLGKGLAGALVIASGTSSYGNIIEIFTPPDLINVPGGANTTFLWDVNGDGTNDFRFVNRYPNTAPGDYGFIWQLRMDPTSASNGLLSYSGQFQRYAFGLDHYVFFGPERTGFSTQSQVVLGSRYSYGGGGSYYYFGGFAAGLGDRGNGYRSVHPGQFAFVGFRFRAADGTHYGWIRLSVNAGIIDFDTAAYNTTPNGQIATYHTDPLIPEPGTLALLAVGAVGVVGAVIKRRLKLCV